MDRILRILLWVLWLAVFALALRTGWAAEETASPGPELASPGQTLERLPTTDLSPMESAAAPVETPLAETVLSTSEKTDAGPDPSPPPPPTPLPKREGCVDGAVGPQASPLARAESKDRSVQLEQIAQQVDRQTRHGLELAGRGAYFAARAEFVGALRLVAEGLDTEQKANRHGRALAAALQAMKEAEDFLPGSARLGDNRDLPGLIAIHTTPVLKHNADTVTALSALRCYLTFAQEQFAASVGREVAGSMALHSLGKLHDTLAQKKTTMIAAAESKAMVFYQAALLVHPENYMAANDLGVLLAKGGRYADARAMLEHSVASCPQSTNWRNLAAVYRQSGRAALADRAAGRAAQLERAEIARRQTTSTAGNDVVRWVDPQTFGRNPQTLARRTTPSSVLPPGATPLPPVRAAQLPVESGRAAPVGRPPATTYWGSPSTRPPAGRTRSMTPVYQPPSAYGPAPTPAAADRAWMSRSPSAYQR